MNTTPSSRFPTFVPTLVTLFLGTLLPLLIARLVTLGLVWQEVSVNPLSEILYGLYVGAKFDCRMAVFAIIPLGIVLAIPALERLLVRGKGLRILLSLVYAALFFGTVVCYAIDFGYFFYLHQRVDATLLDFLNNLSISGSMVWQSYPVVWISLGLAAVTALYVAFVWRVLAQHTLTQPMTKKRRGAWSFATFFLFFLIAYGQISSNLFPLRWSNAFFSTDRNLAILAINPLQNLRDTIHSAQGTRPNIDATRASYPRVAPWLGVTDLNADTLNFRRQIPVDPRFAPAEGKKPRNVVVIIMESMAWPRTSFAPNTTGIEEDPTPTLRTLAQDSLYFPTFFAPTRTTARAVFTTMTGIPDVNRSGGTSSRNQALVNQALLINQFKNYEKFYMIGGSASWANLRGVLTHNIDGLHLMEEGSWEAPNVDVWGISDLALFRESAAAFDKATQPFVAVIQTAGFHRPYTIPDDNADFVSRDLPENVLRNYGYADNKEYNSLRFSDHALGEFFRIARTMPWFNDTVFAIFGDHGLNDPSTNMTPGYLACSLQSNHVPLLIYAPGMLGSKDYHPGTYPQPAGQPDVFPTLATLAGIPYAYNGLGRNLLDPETARTAKQFIGGNSESFVRLVEDGYCYILEETEALYKLEDPTLQNLLQTEPERASRMRQDAQDFYTVSKYLLYNNKKQ